jgi:hypothetical protein
VTEGPKAISFLISIDHGTTVGDNAMSKVLVDTCSGERNWFWIWINPAPLEANDEGRPGDFQLREPLQSKAQQVLLFSKIVVASKFSRVPDAVQRSPVDANGSRECAPDDRLRIVRSCCSASLARRVLPRAV